MKWVLIVLGVVVALVALMAIIGSLVPREHEAGAWVTLRQPADTVWKVVRDLGGLPQWWTEMTRSERDPAPSGVERWRQEMGGFKMALVVETDEPPRRLVTRIDAPPGASFGGSWIYEIAAADSGTRVTVTERGWIANPIFRFMSRFIFGYHRSQMSYLRALGKKFGADATPTRRP